MLKWWGKIKQEKKYIWHSPIVKKGCPSACYYSFEFSVSLFLALFQHLKKRKERQRKANNDARKRILCINFMPLSFKNTFPSPTPHSILKCFLFPSFSFSFWAAYLCLEDWLWFVSSACQIKVGLEEEGDQTSVMCFLLKVKIYNFSSSLCN